ncbi:MAG: hypothetical protein A2X46_15165 [Lentisphaerae bacterium GWF2_57_35]|nr:MAG: hypothetical protein A2X46_15165 [Lentisphaerae bacterium GWF2_57_35]
MLEIFPRLLLVNILNVTAGSSGYTTALQEVFQQQYQVYQLRLLKRLFMQRRLLQRRREVSLLKDLRKHSNTYPGNAILENCLRHSLKRQKMESYQKKKSAKYEATFSSMALNGLMLLD